MDKQLSSHSVNSSTRRYYTTEFKRTVIDYYVSHEESKQSVWSKLVKDEPERGRLLRWMRQLGYEISQVGKRTYIGSMKSTPENLSSEAFADLSREELVEKLLEVSSQLKSEEGKTQALSILIDLAETRFSIPIRKKSNAKPSKQ